MDNRNSKSGSSNESTNNNPRKNDSEFGTEVDTDKRSKSK